MTPALVLAAALLPPAPAPSPWPVLGLIAPPAAVRGAESDGPKDATRAYRAKRALVIGIDYKNNPNRKLENAVSDAEAVAETLKGKYGFTDVVTLTEGRATKRKIEEQLLEDGELCCREGEDDCVLVFFSGHGYRSKPADGRADGELYLLPSDVEFGPAGPRLTTAVNLTAVRDRLARVSRTPKRPYHILLVLDCCHSGEVANLPGHDPGESTTHQADGRAFREPTLLAITAGRGYQPVPDGPPGRHSPFTTALLKALEVVPVNVSRSDYRFTAKDLYNAVRLHGEWGEYRPTPVFMALGGSRQGDFFFYPDPTHKFDPIKEEDRTNLMLAMTPTTAGKWWAEEVPWFMPKLRMRILEKRPADRSLLQLLDKTALEDAADTVLREKRGAPRDLDHLRRLFKGAAGTKVRDEDLRAVFDALAKPTDATPDPEDLHFKAVLAHKLNLVAADGYYDAAVAGYAAAVGGKTNPDEQRRLKALFALCLADRGYFRLRAANRPRDAVDDFARAQAEFGRETPKPFLVFAQLHQAEAHRKLGQWPSARSHVRAALAALAEIDPDKTTMLTANAHKTAAWGHMDQWEFKDAEREFDLVREVVDRKVEERQEVDGGAGVQADQFHIEHGLAMLDRFRGRDAAALAAYRRLTPRIADAVRRHDDRNTERVDYAEVRELLCERLVNSLERQADCLMFAERPDYAEAADDYRRAYLEVDDLDKDKQDERRMDLKFRRAIALALPAAAPLDPGKARALYAEADAIYRRTYLPADGAGGPPAGGPTPQPMYKVCRALAYTLTRPPGPPADGPPAPTRDGAGEADPADFRVVAAEVLRTGRTFDRDTLERMMFGYRLLTERELAGRKNRAVNRADLLEVANQLLQLCRQARRQDRGGQADGDLLVYLRPYLVTVFRAKVEAGQGEARSDGEPARVQAGAVKGLIEIVHDATQPTAYKKDPVAKPALVIFVADGDTHFLLDVPFGTRGYYVLPGVTYEDIRRAGTDAENGRLPLPPDLRRDLAQVAPLLSREYALVCRWADPVEGVRGSPGVGGPVVASKASSPDARRPFPFRLAGVIPDDRYTTEDPANSTPGQVKASAAGR